MTGGEAHRQPGEAAHDDDAKAVRDEGGNNLCARCADGEAEAHLAAAPAEAVTPAGASKSRNTPFAGMELPGRVVATFLRGVPAVLDGKLA